MSLRHQFILVFVAFTFALTAILGWVAGRETERALEAELDEKLRWVAGAAAEVGFDGDYLITLLPGDEGTASWTPHFERLRRLLRYAASAYIVDPENRALVTTEGPDSIPVGTPLFFLELYPDEMERAWAGEEVSTLRFRGIDEQWYKYGMVRIGTSNAMLVILMRADHLEPIATLRRRIAIGSMIAAVFATVIAGMLAAGIIRPLERLGRVALRIQRGRMIEPVREERGDELGRLSRAMERMRVGILRRDDQLRLMLAQVAHEIRNPLGGLELFASVAMETEDREERTRLLSRVRREVEVLNQIIKDFLVFARPEDANSRAHDLREPLEEAVELIRAEFPEPETRILLSLPEEEMRICGDPEQVKRIFLNLLRNAASLASTVRVLSVPDPRRVRIAIRDDGPGISEELQDRIFEPFVTDREQGAGLGLPIVRKLAEANGGTVELTSVGGSRNGEETEFQVYFPRHELPPKEV